MPPMSPKSTTALWRRPSVRTAFRRTRSSTRRAAWSTTICSRRRSPASSNCGQRRLAEVREDMEQHMIARNSHELLRALETQSILDCADMAADASLYREESRWGLYHLRTDFPEKDNENWFCHTLLSKKNGRMTSEKRDVSLIWFRSRTMRRTSTTSSASAPAPDIPAFQTNRRSNMPLASLSDAPFRSLSTTANASPTRAARYASMSARSTCCASAT